MSHCRRNLLNSFYVSLPATVSRFRFLLYKSIANFLMHIHTERWASLTKQSVKSLVQPGGICLEIDAMTLHAVKFFD